MTNRLAVSEESEGGGQSVARQMCKQAQGGRRSKIIQLSSAWLHNMTIVRRNQTTLMTNRLAVWNGGWWLRKTDTVSKLRVGGPGCTYCCKHKSIWSYNSSL